MARLKKRVQIDKTLVNLSRLLCAVHTEHNGTKHRDAVQMERGSQCKQLQCMKQLSPERQCLSEVFGVGCVTLNMSITAVSIRGGMQSSVAVFAA